MNVIPLGDILLVKQCDNARTTDGGIVIPDIAEKPEMGEVVAAGPGKMTEDGRLPNPVKVGDKVIFNANLVQHVRIDGVDLQAVHAEHCYGIV